VAIVHLDHHPDHVPEALAVAVNAATRERKARGLAARVFDGVAATGRRTGGEADDWDVERDAIAALDAADAVRSCRSPPVPRVKADGEDQDQAGNHVLYRERQADEAEPERE
jgi:hypothetical protein